MMPTKAEREDSYCTSYVILIVLKDLERFAVSKDLLEMAHMLRNVRTSGEESFNLQNFVDHF